MHALLFCPHQILLWLWVSEGAEAQVTEMNNPGSLSQCSNLIYFVLVTLRTCYPRIQIREIMRVGALGLSCITRTPLRTPSCVPLRVSSIDLSSDILIFGSDKEKTKKEGCVTDITVKRGVLQPGQPGFESQFCVSLPCDLSCLASLSICFFNF